MLVACRAVHRAPPAPGPGDDELCGAVVDVLSLSARPPRRALDLGAGTGRLSGAIATVFPSVSIEPLDRSAPADGISESWRFAGLPGFTS